MEEPSSAVDTEMAMDESSPSVHATWEEIELSESYLVCSMYEEAASLAIAILKRICDNGKGVEAWEDVQLYDMSASAGMVLVQSLNALGRTSEVLVELKALFGSVAAIPVQVFLTGACFQILDNFASVREFLEEFLGNWRYVDDNCYVLVGSETNMHLKEDCEGPFVLGIDTYLEVVEIYVVRLLGQILKDVDFAVSWVEKAALPEEKQQALLQRLHSLYSPKATNISQGSSSRSPAENHEVHSSSKEQHKLEGSSKAIYLPNGEIYFKKIEPCFWWFRTVNFKIGNVKLAVSNGKLVLGCMLVLICYVFRRKQASLRRMASRKAMAIKKAFVDLWELAFSYQVNPLAAVQSLPAAPARSGR